MEKKFLLDGKCVLSYDMKVFSSDEDHENIMALFIDPLRDEVYEKYYRKQLVQQMLEKVLKNNDEIFKCYCDIKPLIEKEDISVDYIQSDDETLLRKLMREKLGDDGFVTFEEILFEAGNVAFREEMNFLADATSMTEHFRVEYKK